MKPTFHFYKTIFSIFIVILFISSCTIQKRTFNRGFHVEWKSKLNSESKESETSEVKNLSQKNIAQNKNVIIPLATESDSIFETISNTPEKVVHINKKPTDLKSIQHPIDTVYKELSPIRYKKKVYYLDSKKVSKFKDQLFLTRILEGLILVVLFYIGAILVFLLSELNFPVLFFIVGAILLTTLTFLIFYFIEKGINNRKFDFITNEINAAKPEKSVSKNVHQSTHKNRFYIFLLGIISLLAVTLILFY